MSLDWERHISHLLTRYVVRIVQHILNSPRMTVNLYYLVATRVCPVRGFDSVTLLFFNIMKTTGLCYWNQERKVHEWDQITRNDCHSWVCLGPIIFLIWFVVLNCLITLHTAYVPTTKPRGPWPTLPLCIHPWLRGLHYIKRNGFMPTSSSIMYAPWYIIGMSNGW